MQEQEEEKIGRKQAIFSRQKIQELNQRSHITAAMHQQVNSLTILLPPLRPLHTKAQKH